FPRRIRERFDAAVILVTAAIENHFVDTSRLGTLGHQLADDFGRRYVATALEALLRLGVDRAGGSHRLAGTIVDHLGVDVIERAIDRKARPFRRTGDAGAHAGVHPLAMLVFRELANFCPCHCSSPQIPLGLSASLGPSLAGLLLQAFAGDA